MSSWSERLVTIPPGRHTFPKDFVAAHQRRRIFTATADLVAKRGYHGTSIDLITKTARVALSTFYESFQTKEDCFLAAFDDAVAEARDVLAAAVDPQRQWPEQISIGLETVLEMIVASPSKARMCLVEAPGGGPALLDRYEMALEALVPKLREGRELARAPKLPDRAEAAILGGIVWVLHQRIVRADFEQVTDLLPELQQIALRPYLGPAEARRFTEARLASSSTLST
jgi:AcrR family transcriptional regulator